MSARQLKYPTSPSGRNLDVPRSLWSFNIFSSSAENCPRVAFGWEPFWRWSEVEEEEPSEGEPELRLMSIIVKKRETEERERKDERRGRAFRV